MAPISNTDDDLLAGTLQAVGPFFSTTITAQQAQAYKPNPGLFRYALAKLEVDRDELVHVAQGAFSDLAVCTALGIKVIWVNRSGMPLQSGLEPAAILDDLKQLPAVLRSL